MTTLETLLAAVHRDPGDDLARSALADYLEESGDPRTPWARETALWRFSRPDLADPLPQMLAALANSDSHDAAYRGLVRLGERALEPLLTQFGYFEFYSPAAAAAEIGAESIFPQVERLLREGTDEEHDSACLLARDMGRRALPLLPTLLWRIEATPMTRRAHDAAVAVAEMGPLDEESVGRLLALFAPGGAWSGEKSRRLLLPVLSGVLAEAAAALAPPEPAECPAYEIADRLRDIPDEPEDDWAEAKRALAAFGKLDEPGADVVVAVLDFTVGRQLVFPDPHLVRYLPRHPEARQRLRDWLHTPEEYKSVALKVAAEVAADVPELFDDVAAGVDGTNGWRAMRALARFGERGVNFLVARLDVTRDTAGVLNALRHADAVPRSLLPVVDAATDDPNVGPVGAMQLWRLMLSPEELFARVRPFLSDARPNVRPAAVRFLAHGGPPEEVKAVLAPLLRDDAGEVRGSAFESLLAHETDEDARLALFRTMMTDASVNVRERVIRRSGDENVRVLAPDLRILLDTPNGRTRAAAAEVLRGWGEIGGGGT